MRVGFATTYDTSDVQAWLGSVYHMYETLKNVFDDVVCIDNLKESELGILRSRIKDKIYRKVFSKIYSHDLDPLTLKGFGKQVSRRDIEHGCDIIFSVERILFPT